MRKSIKRSLAILAKMGFDLFRLKTGTPQRIQNEIQSTLVKQNLNTVCQAILIFLIQKTVL